MFRWQTLSKVEVTQAVTLGVIANGHTTDAGQTVRETIAQRHPMFIESASGTCQFEDSCVEHLASVPCTPPLLVQTGNM